MARYVPLDCGHMVSRESARVFEVFREIGASGLYCERCGDFGKPKTIKSRPELPDIPLF